MLLKYFITIEVNKWNATKSEQGAEKQWVFTHCPFMFFS